MFSHSIASDTESFTQPVLYSRYLYFCFLCWGRPWKWDDTSQGLILLINMKFNWSESLEVKNAILILKSTLVSCATELPKTKEEFEERLIFKSFFLKSMNAFAPIFYVAFFKGRCVCVSFTTSLLTHFSPVGLSSSSSDFVPLSHRFAGRPGDYVYVFGDYRMEEVIHLFVTVLL